MEASKDKDSELEVPGHSSKDYEESENGLRSGENGANSFTTSPRAVTSPRGFNNPSAYASDEVIALENALSFNLSSKGTDGMRQRRRPKISHIDNSNVPDDVATCSTGSSSPGRMDGVDTPPYMGYIQSNLAPLQVDFGGSPPSNGSSSFPTLSPLMKGIMQQRDVAGQPSTSFSSSSSSFFSTAHTDVHKKPKFSRSARPDTTTPPLTRADSKEIYKTRPRRVSSVSTVLPTGDSK